MYVKEWSDQKTAYNIFLALVKDDTKFKDAWTGLAKAATELGKTPEAKRAIEKVQILKNTRSHETQIGSEHIDEHHSSQLVLFQAITRENAFKGTKCSSEAYIQV